LKESTLDFIGRDARVAPGSGRLGLAPRCRQESAVGRARAAALHFDARHVSAAQLPE
jgi:hypothetical protein